jgi:hypothetical protein
MIFLAKTSENNKGPRSREYSTLHSINILVLNREVLRVLVEKHKKINKNDTL